jgi:hypothetical protein
MALDPSTWEDAQRGRLIALTKSARIMLEIAMPFKSPDTHQVSGRSPKVCRRSYS